MRMYSFAALALFLGTLAAFAQPVPSTQQYQAIANHYQQLEAYHRTKAAAAKLLWQSRAQGTAANGNKYPRPVDSAHYLFDAYTYQADQDHKQFERYQMLAASATSHVRH